MSENTFNPLEINLQTQPLPTYIDADGSFKLNTPMLSSFDFDGLIPKFDGNINAIDVKPGYMIQAVTGEYFPVISVEYDEDDMEDVPSGIVTINYLDDQGNIVSVDYDEADPVAVVYEDWEEKSLGTQGWGITAGGNAIFTNVAVRGRIEAEEGYISGNLTIGSGGSTTLDDVATSEDLDGYIPDGQAAADIITNSTTITGGNISTGQIQSSGYSGGNVYGTAFSTAGAAFNLDYGTITTPNFRIDSSGNAVFNGNITARSFTTDIGTNNNHISMQDDSFSKSDKISFLAETAISAASTRPLNNIEQDPNIQLEYLSYPGGSTAKRLSFRGWKPPGVFLSSPANISIQTQDDGTSSIALSTTDVYMTNSNVYGGVFYGNGSGLTSLSGTNIASGTVAAARIADLDASKITSGTFATDRIPDLAASKITSGTFATARIPTNISITGNAATATRANNADALDYTVGNSTKVIRGNSSANSGISVVSLGSMTSGTGNYLVRNGNSIFQIGPTYSTSTRKIKENIEPILNYENIYNLEPVQFFFKPEHHLPESPETSLQQFGFIAEDVKEVVPQAAQYYNNEVINYSDRALIALSIKALQEQKKKIDDLEDRVLQLESQLGG